MKNGVKIKGKFYPYFDHGYNATKYNERRVEVPYFHDLVSRYRYKNILEIGNVMKYYYPEMKHDVIDLYDGRYGAKNVDCYSYKPRKKYTLVFSISTLEHVDWRHIEDFYVQMFEHIRKNYLKPRGKLIFSVPLGINEILDPQLKKIKMNKTCIKRTSLLLWEECSWKEAQTKKYGEKYPCANGLLIGEITK